MMKLRLILPDVHLQWERAEKIIKSVGADEVIFLGDYFDNFVESPESVANTADWLVHSVKQPNRIHLTGNHDIHYMHANRYFQCSGYAQWKYLQINDFVKWETWSKLQHYYILDETWLLSHAGLHEYFVPDEIKKLVSNRSVFFNVLSSFLDAEIVKGMRNESWIFHAGQIRGGDQKYGGLNWCDMREFIPIKGINQMFGHTYGEFIRWKNLIGTQREIRGDRGYAPDPINLKGEDKSYNVCLDTGFTHYATWDGNKVKIYWVGDL